MSENGRHAGGSASVWAGSYLFSTSFDCGAEQASIVQERCNTPDMALLDLLPDPSLELSLEQEIGRDAVPAEGNDEVVIVDPERPRRGVRLLHVTTVPMTLRFLKGQVAFMREQGFEVEALSSPGDQLTEFESEEGIRCHPVEMPRRITPMRDIAALWEMLRVIKRESPSIVHAHTPKGGLLGIVAARMAGVPIRVYHIHGLPLVTATGHRRRLLAVAERVSCRLATKVLCVSPSVRQEVIQRGLCSAGKVEVLEGGSINGVDALGRFNPDRSDGSRRSVRERYGISPTSMVVGFVGRLVRDKGIVELADAWQLIKADLPSARLLIVGPREIEDPVPEGVIRRLAEDPSVHLVGPNWDTAPLYSAMEMVVLPSYREGLPIVPLEAAAMELPVIATDIPGCRDAVTDGITGSLVPVGDRSALHKAVIGYDSDPALRERHGKAGRERMLRDFSPPRLWHATLKEYCRLLGQSQVRHSH